MSHRATAWAYAQPVTPAGRKFVLVVLADFADEAHSCYPGQAKIAAMTGMSVQSVGRHLKDLEDAGLVSRTRRSTGDGHRTSDRYVLAVSDMSEGSSPAQTLTDSGESNPTKTEVGTLEVSSTYQNEGSEPGQNGHEPESLPRILIAPTPQFERGTTREPLDKNSGADHTSKRRRPETPIPEDFQPLQGHVIQARDSGLDLASELMRFRTHAVANDRRLRNWNAGFSMWLSKASDFQGPRPAVRASNDRRPEGW